MRKVDTMDIVVVGSVALDTIETPKGRIERGLGGSATHFSLAATPFAKPHIVGVVGDDFPQEYLNMLTRYDIDIEGIKTEKGNTFFWSGVYGENFADPKSLATELGVFADFKPVLPEKYRDIPVLFLANIHPALQIDVVNSMKDVKFIGADTMNFWIQGERETLVELIGKVNLLIINELEVRLLSGKDRLMPGAQDVLAMGPDILIVKQGKHGATMITKDDIFMIHAYPTYDITDPTGAGDSFAGGLMGHIARRGKWDMQTIREGMIYGSLTASFEVEHFSTKGLEAMTEEEMAHRLRVFHKATQWPDISGV